MNKHIIIDADGILVMWNTQFSSWMDEIGYSIKNSDAYEIWDRYQISQEEAEALVQKFNMSPIIRHLEPIGGAVKAIGILRDHGYIFTVISSLGDTFLQLTNRKANLYDLFGEDTFRDVICLNIKESKTRELSKFYNNEYFIEDNLKNASVGAVLGLRSILLNYDYNTGHDATGKIIRKDSWPEITDYILNN